MIYVEYSLVSPKNGGYGHQFMMTQLKALVALLISVLLFNLLS